MNPFKGRYFERHIILWAVRWYCVNTDRIMTPPAKVKLTHSL
ncbi:hypothetical protein WKI72_17415 [Candidatus Erwinia dacicola]